MALVQPKSAKDIIGATKTGNQLSNSTPNWRSLSTTWVLLTKSKVFMIKPLMRITKQSKMMHVWVKFITAWV
jgi:hypothetical protein